MKKLKTLKELEAENINKTGEFGVSSYELKQEAIKWIKNFDVSIGWEDWKKFFNITEEDLK